MTDPYVGTRTLMRAFLDAILPPGLAPAPGKDFDHFLSGMGDNMQGVHDAIELLAHVRDPATTPMLDELEREYGITPNTQLTDAQRRATLALVKFKRNSKSTLSTLQDALNRAGLGVGGYGLQVFANDPAVDPGPFTTYAFITMAGQSTACCGYNTGGAVLAVAGVSGGLYVVNGDVFIASPNYLGCGDSRMQCGYFPTAGSPVTACCGVFYTLSYLPITVPSPVDAWAWPLVFFIALSATYDGSGHITALPMATLPANLRQTLIEIILRWKPIHTWCALMCTFI